MRLRSFCWLYIFMAFLLRFPVLHSATAECVCNGKEELLQAFENATISFVGQVEKITKDPRHPNDKQVVFRVLTPYKESEDCQGERVIVSTPESVENCGIEFNIGLDYLVLAKGNPARLRVDACGHTEVLENAREAQRKVAELSGKKQQQ